MAQLIESLPCGIHGPAYPTHSVSLWYDYCNGMKLNVLCGVLDLESSLSHPSLGWHYVFSSFPPHSLRPPPQQLLPLMSEPFQLKLRYLAQRIYGSGEMYWMTFLWPWPKVSAVVSISKNLLVCAIKNHSLDHYKTWQLYCPSHGYNMIRFWRSSVGKFYFGKFSLKISDVFFQGQTLFWPYLRNGWSDWCETKRKCIGWILGTICDFDLWPHSWPWPWMFHGQISK